MKQRQLGVSSVAVGAIGLGCMGMSWAYSESERNDAASRGVINAALDRGVNFLDTASVYGRGHNERLVGQAIAERRDDVVLATKTGLVADLKTRQVNRNATPEFIRADVSHSLQRLGVDVIDLLYLHRVDPDVPIEESWSAMAEFVNSGAVRFLGLSEVTVDEADRAHAVHPVTAIQSEMSMWTRDPIEDGVLGWCRENGAAFVPFAPLGRGFFTGTINAETSFEATDLRSDNPRFTADARASNERLVEAVRSVAARIGATPAQVAIAWTLAQGDHVIPIPGTKRLRYLEENVGAADIALVEDDLAELDAVPAAAGSRY